MPLLLPRYGVPARARRLAALLLLSLGVAGAPAPSLAIPATPAAVSGAGGALASRDAAPGDEPEPAKAYGQLPLSFEANQGQTDPSIDFVAHGQGDSLSLTSGAAVLNLHPPAAAPVATATDPVATDPPPTVLGIQLQGADPHPRAVGQEPLPGTANYFIGNDPSQWHTGIPTYARVRYPEVYPGIDLIYCGTSQGQLENDFLLAPGADPGQIRLGFEGADSLAVDATGTLLVRTTDGQVQLRPPVAY